MWSILPFSVWGGQPLMAGTVVAVRIGPYVHVGIVSERGTVISASKRQKCVVEEALEEFSEGREVRIRDCAGNLPPEQVIARARMKLGQPYDLFGSNCEHFVAYCHGLPKQSPQLQTALLAVVVVGLTTFVLSRRA